MAKALQQVKGKILKKSWYPIFSTKSFDSTYLGECYVAEPSMMLDRTLTVNIANLTGDIRQQGISLQFRISEVEEGKGIAMVMGYDASPAQLRRLVRRGVERLDDSIVCETSAGDIVNVKPFAVTRTQASKSRLSRVRKILREELGKEMRSQTFDDIIKMVISSKLQTSLKTAVKKVFPLKALEIRRLRLVASHAAEKKDAGQAVEGARKAQKAQPEKKEQEPAERKAEVPEKAKEPMEAESPKESQAETQKDQ